MLGSVGSSLGYFNLEAFGQTIGKDVSVARKVSDSQIVSTQVSRRVVSYALIVSVPATLSRLVNLAHIPEYPETRTDTQSRGFERFEIICIIWNAGERGAGCTGTGARGGAGTGARGYGGGGREGLRAWGSGRGWHHTKFFHFHQNQ